MAKMRKRRAFLERVSCRGPGPLSHLVGLDSEFTRDNVEIACQALSLKLVGLVEVDDEGGYAFRITRAGLLVLADRLDEAAALIDGGLGVRRVVTPPPWGVVGGRLRPGGIGMSLRGSGSRAYATQLILAVASGHAIVVGDMVRGNANAPRASMRDLQVGDPVSRLDRSDASGQSKGRDYPKNRGRRP